MFCRNCGNELNENAKYCDNCGSSVEEKKGNDFVDHVMNYEYKYREYDRVLLKSEAKSAITGVWFYLFLIFVVVSLATSIPVLGVVISLVAPIPLFYITKGVLLFKKFDTDLLFKPFTKIKEPIMLVLKVFGAQLLVGLIVALGTVLFIIPGIYFALCYSQTINLLIDNPDLGITKAMDRSKELMDGHKWEFFVFGLSFIGHYLLVIVTFGIYSIYAVPYIQTANLNYYCYIKGIEAKKISNDFPQIEY